ncbi:hypothetical protein DFH11DRAFT_1629975 [Phellopilus nigrolimitatus]|nr:hypothetical protein DFH11DRAFT_1629975 [Phellopilus nigrolimitatus]
MKCETTVEEDCARLGTYQHWHLQCLQCSTCGKPSAPPVPKGNVSSKELSAEDKEGGTPKVSTESAASKRRSFCLRARLHRSRRTVRSPLRHIAWTTNIQGVSGDFRLCRGLSSTLSC